MDKEERSVEIKDLNKTQLILLAILLSFVTSIATGIVTVTLMQQAPTGFTQTVNRVVQQTIEKVVPDYSSSKVQTVVVKEDDLVVDAVAKTRNNIFPVLASKEATTSSIDAYSIGNGTFIASDATLDPTHTYTIKVGATFVDLKVGARSPLGCSLLVISDTTAKISDLPKSVFGKDTDIRAGQTAVLVSSASITKATVQSLSGTIQLSPVPTAMHDGAFVVNLDGNVIGMVLVGADYLEHVVGIDAITKFIAAPVQAPPVVVDPST